MLNRILSFYTKYFAIWVVIFGVVAYFLPRPFIALRGYMDWFFALTMFGIGAVLKIDDFKEIAKKPIIVLIGTTAQFTIMPIGALIVAKVFNLSPEIAVGLILTGSAPGAMASNVMSYIAKADTAYSVSLTTVSTLLAPILAPGLTFFLANSMLEAGFWAICFNVIKMVIVLLCIGFWIRHILKEKAGNIIKIFPAILVTFIIFICLLVIALNRSYLAMVTRVVIIAVLPLNVYGMAAGYGVGRLFRFGTLRKRALSIEIGMQNADWARC